MNGPEQFAELMRQVMTPEAHLSPADAPERPQTGLAGHPGEQSSPELFETRIAENVSRIYAELRLESIGRDVEAEINAWFAECRQQEIERASGPEMEQESQ